MTAAPAFVRNGRLDVLAANRLARSLYAPLFAAPGRPPNLARFVFLHREARDLYVDWDERADAMVAGLWTEAGRAPHDPALSELVDDGRGISVSPRARTRGQRQLMHCACTMMHSWRRARRHSR